MQLFSTRGSVASLAVGGLVVAGVLAGAGSSNASSVRFSDFTPLGSSAGPTANEAMPITLSNDAFRQRSLADRVTQLAAGAPNTGAWDMIATNETGPRPGRFIFSPYETGQSGVQRTNLATGKTETVWMSPTPGGHVSFDASFWTPWGTYITAEESWCSDPNGCSSSPYGRLFELKNPTTAPGITGPVTPASNDGADFVHQNVVPRTSHEGIQFDKAGHMFFIDELNGGSLYRYTSSANWGDVMSGRADYFAAGQTSVLRVGDGNTPNATGSYTWVPITDENGDALPGAITITDPNGVTSVDARNTTDRPEFKGTDYQRPEDMQLQTVNGVQRLYVTTTTTDEVYSLSLRASGSTSSRTPPRLTSPPATRSAAAWPARTTCRSTTRATSTSSRTAAAASTTTSGSPRTATRTATYSTPARASDAGRRTARSARSSPACTSTPPTSGAPG